MQSSCILCLNNQSVQIGGLEGSGSVMSGYVGTATATLTIGGNADHTFSGRIYEYVSTSKIAIVKTGSGTQTFAGNNTYTGGTTISSGTLQAGSRWAFSASSVLTVNGGVADLNGFVVFVAGLSSISSSTGVVANNTVGTHATLTVNSNASYDCYYGTLKDYRGSSGGTLGLTLTTTNPSSYGIYFFTSGSNYSGVTNLLAGSSSTYLVSNVTNAFSPNSTINMQSSCILCLNNQSVQIGGLEGSGSVMSGYNGTATATLTINGNIDHTFSGRIYEYVSTSKIALTKNGSGNQTFTGNNTYTGGTTINQGILQIGALNGSTGSIAGVIHNKAALKFASAVDHIFANDIDGFGSLIVEYNPATTLRLTGNLSYTGGDTIISGTLIKG
jgi:autotransporter-associated beta strand protein